MWWLSCFQWQMHGEISSIFGKGHTHPANTCYEAFEILQRKGTAAHTRTCELALERAFALTQARIKGRGRVVATL